MQWHVRSFGPLVALLLLSACDGSAPDAAPKTPVEAPAISAPLLKPDAAPLKAAPSIRVADAEPLSSKTLPADAKILPLSRILAIATKAVPGEVIEVDYDDDDDGGPEYEIEILTPEGRMIELKIAAKSGKILKTEED